MHAAKSCAVDNDLLVVNSVACICQCVFFDIFQIVRQRSESARLEVIRLWAEWQSGYAAACKAVYLGSIPGSASKDCDSTI